MLLTFGGFLQSIAKTIVFLLLFTPSIPFCDWLMLLYPLYGSPEIIVYLPELIHILLR